MIETPRQRRTAASIVEGVKNRLADEQAQLQEAETLVIRIKTRIFTIQAILQDAEKNGSADDE